MKTFDEIMDSLPEGPIYHYTSQLGLIGMIESKSIWATSIHYLNDSEEFSYAINIARDQLKHKIEACSDDEGRNLLQTMEQVLLNSEGVNLFVCSFSEQGDLLSQWRAYCPPGSGFSLGFRHEALKPLLDKQGFALAPCIYERETQVALVVDLIQEMLALYNQLTAKEPNQRTYNINKTCQTYIARQVVLAAVIKHPNFSEEREWRVISRPLGLHDPQILFRKGISMVTPYVNFSLTDLENSFPVFEVIVGPTPHKELARNAVVMLTNVKGLAGIRISLSTVPFRGW